MSGKKLQTDAVVNELSGGVFFRPRADEQVSLPHDEVVPADVTELSVRKRASNAASTGDSSDASSSDRSSDSIGASTVAITKDSELDSPPARTIARPPARRRSGKQVESLASTLAGSDDLVDAIYRIVKRPGKEVSYVRLTEREKSELTSILAGLGQDHGYKVTETELIRIAICNLLADYAANGTESLLMKVIIDLKD